MINENLALKVMKQTIIVRWAVEDDKMIKEVNNMGTVRGLKMARIKKNTEEKYGNKLTKCRKGHNNVHGSMKIQRIYPHKGLSTR